MTNFTYTEEDKKKMLEWADVLESGKYKQQGGWGSLERGSLCCLNVALVHFTGEDLDHHRRKVGDKATNLITAIFGQEWRPGDGVEDWAWQFIQMNDFKGYTFPQIAAEIRKMVSGPVPAQ